MGAGKNRSHRKKRISKHVLESVERKKLANVEAGLLAAAAAGAAEAGGGGTSPPTGASAGVEATDTTAATTTTATGGSKESSSRRERKLLNFKDPAEASTYLSLWKHDRADNTASSTTKIWKFNKNTQSWLLRHMYDGNKVNKTTFAILLEYIIAGKCEGVRSNVQEDAKVRARRYKEWEKTTTSTTTEKEMKTTLALMKKDDEGVSSYQRPISSGEAEGAKRSSSLAGVATTATTTTTTANDDEWKTMDEHEKRKVYKRARKALDALETKNEGCGNKSKFIKC